ncbi:kinesin-like protein KIF13A, partial [Pollicipes pollicipes]|uniref:kinesin-like protein KIF13A n=1 Tax=Pollicipes pollicipes TaxID=41117 RepID=UPI0018858C66
WGCSQTQVCPPIISNSASSCANDRVVVQFDHCRDFVIPVCEEFIENCAEGALSVEVWGHRSAGFSSSVPTTLDVVDSQLAKARSLADRWAELTRKLELWVELQELNDHGEYQPVEVCARTDVASGGVYQLRQGQQRRLAVRVLPVLNSGTLPLVCDAISAISIGSVTCRYRMQKPLDSYQEADLNQLRERWSSALVRRRQYLDSHLQKIIKKQDKTEADNEREKSLLDQWIQLNEERNAVLVPAAGSGIPGSPLSAHVQQRAGLERHVPVLFLNLNADDLSSGSLAGELACAGVNSHLPKEHGEHMVALHPVRAADGPCVAAVAQWDSSVHDSVYLNRITPANERVYLVLLVRVRLCQPLPMDIVLRKRLAVNIYKPTFTNKLMRSISLRRTDQVEATGVVYEVVSNIPKASEELEDRESLAQIAASGQEASDPDGETYIEKYLQGVSAVDSILRLDRLRQSVAVKELIQDGAGPLSGTGSMRKTASVPNISYFHRPDGVNRSESFLELSGLPAAGDSADPPHHRLSLGGHKADSSGRTANRPTFLNLTAGGRLQGAMSKSTPSPGSLKLASRMSTLHEDHDREGSPERADAAGSAQPAPGRGAAARTRLSGRMRSSRTFDSLVEIPAPAKTNSPSVTSSGYGSQAVSSSNLSSEDSVSLQSIDETPDSEASVVAARRPADTSRRESERPPASAAAPEPAEGQREEGQTQENKGQPRPGESQQEPAGQAPENHQEPELQPQEIPRESQPQPQEKTQPEREQEIQRQMRQEFEAEQGSSLEGLQDPPQQIQQEPEQKPPQLEHQQEPSEEQGEPLQQEPNHDTQLDSNGQDWEDHEAGKPQTDNCIAGLAEWVTPGEAVLVRPQSLSGHIRFVGPVRFAPGCWVGVDLDLPQGKNDGSVKDVQYFQCQPRHGIFVRVDKLIWDHRRSRAQRARPSPAAAAAGSSRRASTRDWHD